MSGFGMSRERSGEAWFRLGRIEVTTTVLIVFIGAVGLVLSAIAPVFLEVGYLAPERVLRGDLWRLFTWPFVDRISLWSVISLALLWYFGRDLEAQIGRGPMMTLYVGMWSALSALYLIVGWTLGAPGAAGMGYLQFLVLLLWIAEYPRRPFFFGIPAWVIGAVLVAVQVLGFVASRSLGSLVALLGSFVLTAVLARRVGLLSELTFLPGRPGAARARGRSVAPPPNPSRRERKQAARQATDAERIDALLEKISREGMHSLSASERRELEKLRQRRQQG